MSIYLILDGNVRKHGEAAWTSEKASKAASRLRKRKQDKLQGLTAWLSWRRTIQRSIGGRRQTADTAKSHLDRGIFEQPVWCH